MNTPPVQHPLSGTSVAGDNSTSHAGQSSKAISVSELNRQVKRLLEASYRHIWVSGELSGLSRPNSGHWYFSLKDERAQIRCAMFRSANQRLKFQPKEGDQVIVRAKVSLYEGRGDYQLIVEGMEPAGLGQLQAAFEALKLKLAQEGLFDTAHKKPLPQLPKKVAVVTSETGAVIHDIINVTAKRFPALEILLLPVRVQGDGSAKEIERAIQTVNAHRLAEVLIVGRGGGSLEDLWAFNEECVARAIHASHIPVVSAVGHEVDFTIADLVADYRAPTPSAAAEAITPDQFELAQNLDGQQRRLAFLVDTILARLDERVRSLSKRLKNPAQTLADKQQRILELDQRLQSAIQNKLKFCQQETRSQYFALTQYNPASQIQLRQEHILQLRQRLSERQSKLLVEHKHRLSLAAQMLHTASPLATLGRGYAIALNKNKKVIRTPEQVSAGDELSVKVEGGDIPCTVR